MPQGGVLSPKLFVLLLDEALRTSKLLRSKIQDGTLLAYADDIILSCGSLAEVTDAITAIDTLHGEFGLKINKKKCSILCTSPSDNLAPYRMSAEDKKALREAKSAGHTEIYEDLKKMHDERQKQKQQYVMEVPVVASFKYLGLEIFPDFFSTYKAQLKRC